MSRQPFIPILLAVAVIPLRGASAQALPSDDAAVQTIRRMEDQWLRAKTAREAGSFLAPDFILISTRGVIEKP